MRTLILVSLLFADAHALEHLRGDPLNELQQLVSALVYKIERMEAKITDLSEHRSLSDVCDFVVDINGDCKLVNQALVLDPNDSGMTTDATALKVYGKAEFENEIEVEDKATFKDDVKLDGKHNELEVEGDCTCEGKLEVRGRATFKKDITAEKDSIIEGDLTVESGDVLFKNELDVEGSADFSGDVRISGDLECNGGPCR
jgi:cytoskeletal protein CcmA (bactofilin family)